MFINYRPFYVFILSLCVCVCFCCYWIFDCMPLISRWAFHNYLGQTTKVSPVAIFFLGQEPRIIIQLLNYAKRW